MLTKILSGGQTGTDRAVLDFAVAFDIDHDCWMAKGPTATYTKRIEQNVINADATLIFSLGPLTGGSALTMKLAQAHNKPCLHVDLNDTQKLVAAENINAWIADHKFRVLNVAGPRASKAPTIYDEVYDTLKAVLLLGTITDNIVDTGSRIGQGLPQTVDQAVERLVSELRLKDRVMLASMSKTQLEAYYTTLGLYIRNHYGLSSGNQALMASCRELSGNDHIREDQAATLIIVRLWETLTRTHTLRAVK